MPDNVDDEDDFPPDQDVSADASQSNPVQAPNAPDEIIETTNESWGQNIGGSIGGMLFGVILFLIAFPLLWWNEGRSVDNIRRLDEGRNLAIPVSADAVSAVNNNKLIYISGKAGTSDLLQDAFFGVSANALRLKRKVEMYQWGETKSSQSQNNLGGDSTTQTSYSYRKTWSETPLDSSHYKHPEGHANPDMPYKTQIFSAGNVHIGAFGLSDDFINQMDKFRSYPLSMKNFSAMDVRLQKAFIYRGSGYFYGNPSDPQVGSLRITYETVEPQNVSVIGQQNNSTVIPYPTQHGDIKMLAVGTKSADSMFVTEERSNGITTWLIRAGGIFLMFVGISAIFAPLAAIANVVPLLGDIISVGTGTISFLIALVLSFTVIAVAWIFYRPVLGILLLLAAAGASAGGVTLIAKVKAARQLRSSRDYISR